MSRGTPPPPPAMSSDDVQRFEPLDLGNDSSQPLLTVYDRQMLRAQESEHDVAELVVVSCRVGRIEAELRRHRLQQNLRLGNRRDRVHEIRVGEIVNLVLEQ